MKKIILRAACVGALCFAVVSCNNMGNDSTASNDSTGTKTDSTDMKKDTGMAANPGASSATATNLSADDAKFMVDAANGGMSEVAMGNVAEQNASNTRVKDFGAMMVRDHGKGGDELKQLAGRKNVTLPAALPEKEQKHVNDLQKKSGMSFDKSYMSMMVDDHKKDIKEFEDAQKKVTDPDLKDFINRTLPVLRTHLDSAVAVNNSMKNKSSY